MKKFNSFILGIVPLTLLVTSARRSYAQVALDPQTPTTVLNLASQSATFLGIPTTWQPSSSEQSVAYYTGHSLWKVSWDGANDGYDITIDSDEGRVAEVWNSTEDSAIASSVQAGEPYTVTQDQAVAAANQMALEFGVASGDWRTQETAIWEVMPNQKVWSVRQQRYVDEYPSFVDQVQCEVNPYTGTVLYWNRVDEGQYVEPVGPVVAEPQARQTAQTAFNDFASDMLGSGETIVPSQCSGPLWMAPDLSSTLCRLGYRYYFLLPQTDTRSPVGIEARVDAQTGELWDIKVATIGIAGHTHPVSPSPRFTLLHKLAETKTEKPLAFAIAYGKPASACRPSQTARRFARMVGGSPVDFAFNPMAHRLTWQTGSDKWSGVALPDRQVAAITAWLLSVSGTGAARPLPSVTR